MRCGYGRGEVTCDEEAETTRRVPMRLHPACPDWGLVHLCLLHAAACDMWEFGRRERERQ